MAEAVAIALFEAGVISYGATMTVIAGSAYINFALTVIASSAYSAQQKRKAQSRARAAYSASLKDRELMIRSAVAPRRVIYGRDRVSGPIVYAQSTGSRGEFLHVVIALATHECDAIETIYFNDVALPEPDGSGDITSGEFIGGITHSEHQSGTGVSSITLAHTPSAITYTSRRQQEEHNYTIDVPVTPTSVVGNVVNFASSDDYDVNYEWIEVAPRVRIRKHLGGAGQTADADLIAASGGKWTADHVGTGICYLYVRLEFDNDVFGQVGLPNISAVVRGKKLYDPRSGLTVWSENAALAVADWLRDGVYGLGAAAGEVPTDEVTTAANICDEAVNITVSTTQARYVFNGSFTTESSPRDVLADLLSGMAGSCVWSQGRWLLRAGAARTPSVTITADKLAGNAVSIAPKASRSELFNAVRVTYRDPSQGWAEVQAPLVTNATYEAADGDVRIVRSISMPGVMDAMRAQRLGKIELERERQALTVQLTGNLATYDLAPTDTCYLDLTRYGFSNKLMEVRQRTWQADGTLPYTLRETAAGVWDWNYGEATTVDLAPDTVLPNPYTAPAALTDLTAASGTAHLMRLGDGTVVSRALVQWTASTDAFVTSGGKIECGWKRPSDTDWQVAPSMAGDEASTYLLQVPDGHNIMIRVRAVNASGRNSAWTTISHLVQGKSDEPSDPAGFAGSVSKGRIAWVWTACPDADYAATELRLGGTDWASGATPAAFLGAANTYQQIVTTAATYTARIKHLDTSGNYSVTEASYSVVVAAGDLVQDGTDGTDGTPAYVHIRYSNDGGGTFTGSGGTVPGAYIGTYTDSNPTASPSVGAYTWALIKGADGTNGTPGAPGDDGQTSYLHIKYSNDGGSTFTASTGETPGAYIGTYTDFNVADSSSVGDYSWALIKGADGTNGIPGAPGDDGQTSYLHIKWSNDGGANFTASSGETPGDYIGTYTDFTAADSLSVGSYTWALVKGAAGTDGTDGADGDPAVSNTLTSYAVTLAADASGVVASFADATTTMKVMLGTADDTANWSFSRTNGTGVTSSLSTNVLTVSALSVDSGYVDITATRTGYATQTARFTLTKAKSSTATGMVPGFAAESLDLRIGSSGTATAALSFQDDGRIYSDPLNDAASDAGDWYLPNTTSIGSTYSVKVVQTSGSTMSGAALNTWHAISGEPSFELSNGVADTVKTATALAYIALTADTSQVLAMGSLQLEAEKMSV